MDPNNKVTYHLVYHADYAETRLQMCLLRYVAWCYGFLLVFLFWFQIFPNISKANIGILSWQVIYVLFIMTLAQRQHLRHALFLILLTLIFLLLNGWIATSFVYQLIECRYYRLCTDNGNAFVWVTIIMLTITLLNILVGILASKCISIVKKIEHSGANILINPKVSYDNKTHKLHSVDNLNLKMFVSDQDHNVY